MTHATERAVARLPKQPHPQPAAEALEGVQVAVEEAPPTRALVRLVGDELGDDRPPPERGPENGTPEHAGRVDHV